MKNKRVIYPQENGVLAVLVPIAECGLSLEEIISKDIPKGSPYLIVEESELPDGQFHAAWEADFTDAPINN